MKEIITVPYEGTKKTQVVSIESEYRGIQYFNVLKSILKQHQTTSNMKVEFFCELFAYMGEDTMKTISDMKP